MEFIFICPKRNMTFKTTYFNITEKRGVISDSSGNNMLDIVTAMQLADEVINL
jgi:hypothetical protein